MTNENQYFIKKMIDNNTIIEIQKMLDNGSTYSHIKKATGVSDGTISRIKNGKIKPNRTTTVKPIYTQNDVKNLVHKLELAENKIKDLTIENYELKDFNFKARKILKGYERFGLINEYNKFRKQEENEKHSIRKIDSFKV